MIKWYFYAALDFISAHILTHFLGFTSSRVGLRSVLPKVTPTKYPEQLTRRGKFPFSGTSDTFQCFPETFHLSS